MIIFFFFPHFWRQALTIFLHMILPRIFSRCTATASDESEIGQREKERGQRFFSHVIADIPFRHSLLSERKCINFHRWTLTYAREIHSRLWRGAFWLWLMAPHLPSACFLHVCCTILHTHAFLSLTRSFCPFFLYSRRSRISSSCGHDNFTITIRQRKKYVAGTAS